jgi:hypothetical protein
VPQQPPCATRGTVTCRTTEMPCGPTYLGEGLTCKHGSAQFGSSNGGVSTRATVYSAAAKKFHAVSPGTAATRSSSHTTANIVATFRCEGHHDRVFKFNIVFGNI